MFTKNLLSFLSLGILLLGVGAVLATSPKVGAQVPPVTPAGTDLYGWAWSSNIGWFCFKDATSCPNAIVKISADGKLITGHAWNPNIGWIKFDPGVGPDGYPDAAGITDSNKNAQFFGSNILGWARACTVFVNNGTCSGALEDNIYRGGWDGWLKMGGGGLLGGGVRLVGQQLTGFAWGGEILGWVKFDQVWDGPGTCTGVCIQQSTDAILTVQILGTGEVRGTNIQCVSRDQSTGCSANLGVASGASLRYIVTNNPFVRWEGDCDRIDTGQCIITRMNNNRTVRAIFADGEVVQENNDLIVNITGTGVVTNINDGWTTAVTASHSYDSEEEVSLNFTPATGGTYVVTGACNTSSAAPIACDFDMDEDRTINVEFTNVPQYCVNISYTQGNSMQVNYQNIRNLDEPHRSTKAKVEIQSLPGAIPAALPPSVDLTLNLGALVNHPRIDPADNIPPPTLEPEGVTFSVPMNGFKLVNLYYPSDGQPTSGYASPYAAPGTYQLALDAGPNVEFCTRDSRPYITSSYIDIRQREQ
ncbi:MAG: hypothetical protein KBC48_02295 [Candidatus Pacebacteria bacterium]|nr:hypothetical protein [Candidatus Paceibacterota bacterium]